MFDGAKVARRVEGNLWVFGMVVLEKTCFKGQMPSENRFQTAFSVYLKQTGKGSNILQSSYSHKRFRTLRLRGSRTRWIWSNPFWFCRRPRQSNGICRLFCDGSMDQTRD